MSLTLEDLARRTTSYLDPIDGASPAGVAARSDPAYEAVASEIAKLESLVGSAVSWPAVVKNATGLLQARTKDLLLAAYLARALHATQGLDGLVTGTALLAGLVERYWESMQPDVKRPRARSNALQWFIERSTASLQATPPANPDPVQLEALGLATRRLAEMAREKLQDATPAFGRLLEEVARLEASSAAKEPPPPPQPPQQQAPWPSPEPVATPAPVEIAPADPTERLSKVGDALLEIARELRAASAVDPSPFRILRNGLWLHLAASPSAPGGKTSIPPPPEALRNRLGLLEQNGQWLALLDEAESALPQHRFALDLQRASWHALRGLGATHDGARAAVALETRTLLARMPELVSLSFADGTPLASQSTRAWIDQHVAPRERLPAAPAAQGIEEPPELGEARAFLSGGKVEEGLALMQRAVQRASTGRGRFLARLELARACDVAGLTALAKATYEALEREVRAHDLESWEPALAVETLRGIIAAARALGKDVRGASPQLVEQYQRLCSLDPAAAHDVWP